MSISANDCETTILQSKLVRIHSDVLSDAKDDIVVLPITIPDGPDWEYLKAEKILIDFADVMITPYYEETSMSNRTAYDKGMVTGNFPVYVNVYSGNTLGEEKDKEEAKSMNQMIYTGVYMVGPQSNTSRIELRGTVHKTIFKDQEFKEYSDKEDIYHKWIDGSLLRNKETGLQLCRVALSIRKSDFKVAATSAKGESSSQVFRRIRKEEIKAETKDKKVVKPKKGEEEVVETIDEPEAGSLIVDAPFYITTKVKLYYKRQPY